MCVYALNQHCLINNWWTGVSVTGTDLKVAMGTVS